MANYVIFFGKCVRTLILNDSNYKIVLRSLLRDCKWNSLLHQLPERISLILSLILRGYSHEKF